MCCKNEKSRDIFEIKTTFVSCCCQGHRAHTMYVGLHVPSSSNPTRKRSSHHRRHHRHHRQQPPGIAEEGSPADNGNYFSSKRLLHPFPSVDLHSLHSQDHNQVLFVFHLTLLLKVIFNFECRTRSWLQNFIL